MSEEEQQQLLECFGCAKLFKKWELIPIEQGDLMCSGCKKHQEEKGKENEAKS